MDKRRTKVFRDKLLDRREGLVGQVQAAELYSRERDAEATQDPADMAANAYTKELLVSMSSAATPRRPAWPRIFAPQLIGTVSPSIRPMRRE